MRTLIALGVLLGLAAPAIATTEDLQRRLFQAATAPRGVEALGAAGRMQFAEVALEYWRHFDSRIPRYSPTDQAWLESELKTTDTERIGRVINGRQYAQWLLSRDAESCVSLFENLTMIVGTDRLTETYYWLKTTRCWQDSSDKGTYLRNAGLSNGRLDDTFKMCHSNYLFSGFRIRRTEPRLRRQSSPATVRSTIESDIALRGIGLVGR